MHSPMGATRSEQRPPLPSSLTRKMRSGLFKTAYLLVKTAYLLAIITATAGWAWLLIYWLELAIAI